jgi:hypothetical protein
MNNVSNHKGTIIQKARLSVRGKILMTCLSPRTAERGGQGGIAPGSGPGAPRNFLLGPSHFFGLNISAQRARYLFLGGQSTEI